MKTFAEKLEYHILVESPTIESATFLYKTGLSKVNVKTNKMGSEYKLKISQGMQICHYILFVLFWEFNFSIRIS